MNAKCCFLVFRMPLSGAERQRRYIQKKKKNRQYELYKEKHAIHVRNGRAKNRRNEDLLSRSAQKQLQEKRREATRKRVSKYRCRKREETVNGVHVHVPHNINYVGMNIDKIYAFALLLIYNLFRLVFMYASLDSYKILSLKHVNSWYYLSNQRFTLHMYCTCTVYCTS